MRKYITILLLLTTVIIVNDTVCIDHGDIIICSDDKGNSTTIIKDNRWLAIKDISG